MKLNCKYFGVLLTASLVTITAPAADDKPAATNAPAATKAPNLDDLFPDTVIAKGKTFEIKRSRLDEAIAGMRATAIARGAQLTPADMTQIEKLSFEHLLQIQLLNTKATDADRTKAAAAADKQLEMIRKRAPSEEALTKQLKSMNLTIDQLKGRLAEDATAEQVLRDKVTVTDDQMKKFFDDNPADFEDPEMVHGYHILIAAVDKNGAPLSEDDKKTRKKTAEALLKRVKDGEDFSKVARESSEDPAAKETGGEFTLPRTRMPAEFASAAFSMQTNQVSDIVTSQLGFHIIKFVAKVPATKLEYAKVSPDIKNFLETKEMEKVLPEFSAKLQKESDVQILDEELKSLLAAAATMPGADASSSTGADVKPAGKKP